MARIEFFDNGNVVPKEILFLQVKSVNDQSNVLVR